MFDMQPIEKDFPIEKVNEIANEEGKGGTSRPAFEPLLYLHKWWARRLGSVFRTIIISTLIDEKTKIIEENGETRLIKKSEINNPCDVYVNDVDFNGKIILDPFMGAGTTIIEGLRTNCKVIGQDLNPIPWFLVKNAIDVVDIPNLSESFKTLEKNVKEEIKSYYKTICPVCLDKYTKQHDLDKDKLLTEIKDKLPTVNNSELYNLYTYDDPSRINYKKEIFADSIYYFWIKEISCEACNQKIPLFKSYIFANKKSGRKTIGYYVLCPECSYIFEIGKNEDIITCPVCGKEFNPKKGNVSGGSYICPNKDCGQKSKIVENVKLNGKPKERLYAVEYYCPVCDKKKYKKADEFDFELFKKANEEFKSVNWFDKYIPSTTIPEGEKTKEMINYGYNYWMDMFNSRQLLSQGKLIKHIIEANFEEKQKEFLLLAFSKALEYNNMLCEYHRVNQYIYNLFRIHAFHTTLNPVENNPWGAKYGFGTFKNLFNKNLKFKEFNEHPFEKYPTSSGNKKKFMKIKVKGVEGDIFNDPSSNSMILCGDSSFLNIPDKSVDYVITDPPYYDNVMYSELSEFFYSWLRLALKNTYEHFRSEHVPKTAEVIKNKYQGKGEKEFIDGLTAVFKESNKKLKDNGLMVFTFHHKDEKAWGAVLQSVLKSGFFITAIYPVQSEMGTSTHILDRSNVQYDMVIVCKKRKEKPKKRHWSQIEDEIYFRVEDEIKRLEKHKKSLSSEDLFVVTIGKCLEIYSKHYPFVYKDDKEVSINEALSSIREVVDAQLMYTRFNQVELETDTLTAVYLFYFTNKTMISYDSLNKSLKMRNIPIEDVVNSGLLEKSGHQLLILTPQERSEIIRSMQKEKLSAIDRAHYLYYQWKNDSIYDFDHSLNNEEKPLWSSDSVLKTLDYLFEIEQDDVYHDLSKFMIEKWSKHEYWEV